MNPMFKLLYLLPDWYAAPDMHHRDTMVEYDTLSEFNQVIAVNKVMRNIKRGSPVVYIWREVKEIADELQTY